MPRKSSGGKYEFTNPKHDGEGDVDKGQKSTCVRWKVKCKKKDIKTTKVKNGKMFKKTCMLQVKVTVAMDNLKSLIFF